MRESSGHFQRLSSSTTRLSHGLEQALISRRFEPVALFSTFHFQVRGSWSMKTSTSLRSSSIASQVTDSGTPLRYSALLTKRPKSQQRHGVSQPVLILKPVSM